MDNKESPSLTPTSTTSTKPKKIRCFVCRKKLGLMPFECKCGLKFCALHRAPETHNCTYDYKSEGCKKLEERLVKVCAEKITVI